MPAPPEPGTRGVDALGRPLGAPPRPPARGSPAVPPPSPRDGERVEVEPLVFRSVENSDYIVFRENALGEITGVGESERIGWSEQRPFHLAVLASCVAAFLAYLLSSGIRAIRQRPSTSEGRVARISAISVAGMNLMFITGLPIFLRNLGAITPLPVPILVWLSLPLVSLAVTVLLPAFAATAWRKQWWTLRERLGYSTLALLAVVFLTCLNYWRLLGIRY